MKLYLFKEKMTKKLEKIFGKNINSVMLRLDKDEIIHEIKVEFADCKDQNKKEKLVSS